ncbi:hypothetical protein BJ165DRAFT_1534085 [Panaeolus papilionaceus]|nr:hypothetical protein BJ165DRAFT_1534085 [Panaeolus papilionaceus]
MDLTPPGAPTLTAHAAFHGHPLALSVVDDAGKVLVGGGRSIGWGGAMTEMPSHLDAIEVGYGGGKRDRMRVEIEMERKGDKDDLEQGNERRVGHHSSDGWFQRDIIVISSGVFTSNNGIYFHITGPFESHMRRPIAYITLAVISSHLSPRFILVLNTTPYRDVRLTQCNSAIARPFSTTARQYIAR